MKRHIIAAVAACALVAAGDTQGFAQSAPKATLPEWWVAHVDFMTRGGGSWYAENATGAADPAIPDGFAMEWTVSNERHLLTGRLYGIEGGKESREFWTFREFYHPGERRAVIEQWGGPGVYGRGETTSTGANLVRVEVTFWLPDGRSWREGHRNVEKGDEYVTDSFDIDDAGKWTPNGHYVWRRQQHGTGAQGDKV